MCCLPTMPLEIWHLEAESRSQCSFTYLLFPARIYSFSIIGWPFITGCFQMAAVIAPLPIGESLGRTAAYRHAALGFRKLMKDVNMLAHVRGRSINAPPLLILVPETRRPNEAQPQRRRCSSASFLFFGSFPTAVHCSCAVLTADSQRHSHIQHMSRT